MSSVRNRSLKSGKYLNCKRRTRLFATAFLIVGTNGRCTPMQQVRNAVGYPSCDWRPCIIITPHVDGSQLQHFTPTHQAFVCGGPLQRLHQDSDPGSRWGAFYPPFNLQLASSASLCTDDAIPDIKFNISIPTTAAIATRATGFA